LDQNDNYTTLMLTGDNFIDSEEYEHSIKTWNNMLVTIKEFLENKKS